MTKTWKHIAISPHAAHSTLKSKLQMHCIWQPVPEYMDYITPVDTFTG